MEKIAQLQQLVRFNAFFAALQIVFGGIFIALMAQIAIPLPFTPVPISMQSLAILMIALTMKKERAFLAVLFYLAQATTGLPVLAAGCVNPLWMIGPRAGYLVGFAFSAYLGSYIKEKFTHGFFCNFIVCFIASAVIILYGALWLSLFVGIQNAIIMGVTPFLIGDLYKILFITMFATALKR